MPKSQTTIVFYQPDEDIFENLDIPAQPLPVREENQEKIFKKKKVDLAGLVEELFYFLSEAPEYIDQYREMVGKITYNLGVEVGNKKKHEEAAAFFEKGLILNPQNVSLRVNYAQALYAQGLKEEAILQYLKVVEHPAIPTDPILWTVIARLLFDEEQYVMAHELLKEAGEMVPKEDDGFWNFYRLVRDKAGVEEIEDVENLDEILAQAVAEVSENKDDSPFYGGDLFGDVGEPESWEDELDKAFGEDDSVETLESNVSTENVCPSCGTVLKTGAKFCGKCGAKTDSVKTEAVPQAKKEEKPTCPHCGEKIKKGAKFCGACGGKI